MTAPALPPRELPPLMPPPRPPSFCTPATTESPHDAVTGTVRVSPDLLDLYNVAGVRPTTLRRVRRVHTIIESILL
jgi:hypothetical protein